MDLNKSTSRTELSDKITSCSLCEQTLKIPKSLPCLHSFCMECLNGHILQTARDVSFPCPVCREQTPAPDKTLKPDQWAKYFQPSPLISSMMDINDLKHGDRKCDPCKHTRKRSMATTWCPSCREALCSVCANSHSGMRLTRGHVLMEISKIRTQPIAAIMKDEKCPIHEDQFLQYFCQDHSQQCCPTCAIVTHRRCENVLEMNALGKEIRTQEKAEKLLKRLNACVTFQEELLKSKGGTQDSLANKKKDILKEIQNLKSRMIDSFNEMEKAFVNEFDSLHDTRIHELKVEITDTQRVVDAINEASEMLEAALLYGSDAQIFLTYEKVRDDCRRYEKLTLENNKEQNEIVYSFKMDDRLKTVVNTVKKFGHLSVENDLGLSKISFRECQVRETGTLSAKSPFDDLRAVDIFPNEDVLVADRMSKAVLVFRSSGEFICHANVSTRPWGVAVLGVQTACVSLPECQEIEILKYGHKLLERHRTIKTNISCFAVTNFSGEYLALQYVDDQEQKGRVQISQSNEQCYHKAVIDITGTHKHVQGIAYDEATGKIFISTDFDAIECYNTKGRLMFRNSYTGYGDFRGMTVDRQSNVYVTSYAGKGVLQLTHEGERIRIIPTTPLAPLDVALSQRGNKMVVVGRSDIVYVYTFR